MLVGSDDGQMTTTERTDADGGSGVPVEAAATTVVEADPTTADDVGAVAATLRGVADAGTLTDESVQDALAHLSKVVSTPATRVELSGIELDAARSDAGEVADVPTVAARLDVLADDVESVESAVGELDSDLRTLADRVTKEVVADEGAGGAAVEVYEVAAERERIHAEATRLQATADDLTTEIESFRQWLARPSVRHEELRADAAELTDAVDALEQSVEEVADASESAESERSNADVAEAWFDCSIRCRVLALQAADIRAAAADVSTVDGRLGSDPEEPAVGSVRAQADDLADHLGATAGRLDVLARPAWRERYGSRLPSFDESLATFEPPVEWGAVLTALEDVRDD